MGCALPAADSSLAQADVVVWAVKPQQFHEAAAAASTHLAQALHISVAAGITTATLARWLGSARIVRCMPNTPALVGQGMTGIYAAPCILEQERALVDAVLVPTGQRMWLEQEALIDSLTAISGSGPAYVFYWIEALIQGGVELGLSHEQARQLAVQTFAGSAALVAQSTGVARCAAPARDQQGRHHARPLPAWNAIRCRRTSWKPCAPVTAAR